MERLDCDERWGKGLWLVREGRTYLQGDSSHRNGEEGEIGQGFWRVHEEVYGLISWWISLWRGLQAGGPVAGSWEESG